HPSHQPAKEAIELLNKTIVEYGKTVKIIVEKGTNPIIKNRKADFAGRLGSISGGGVKLNLDLEWLGKKQNIKFNFNLKSPAKSIKALVDKLMKK
ncbi:MAG: hypothetical protein AAF985_23540, partial [Bacteroidota bacterium]